MQVTEALSNAGLESSNLIVGIDFTKSNEWTGLFLSQCCYYSCCWFTRIWCCYYFSETISDMILLIARQIWMIFWGKHFNYSHNIGKIKRIDQTEPCSDIILRGNYSNYSQHIGKNQENWSTSTIKFHLINLTYIYIPAISLFLGLCIRWFAAWSSQFHNRSSVACMY